MSVSEREVAESPARFGEARFGYSRLNVYNPAIQSLYARNGNYRSFTRRVANWNVARDPTTGWRHPTYEDVTINGILVEERGRIVAFPSGVVFTQVARLVTLDGVSVMDQIVDGDVYYRVMSIEEHMDPHTDPTVVESFSHRVVRLSRLELYKEG